MVTLTLRGGRPASWVPPVTSQVEFTSMRVTILTPVIAACAQIMPDRETHPSLDRLFMHAGAPGDPPEGSKPVKVQEWLRRINKDESVEPLNVLGRLIEAYMENYHLKEAHLTTSRLPRKRNLRPSFERRLLDMTYSM